MRPIRFICSLIASENIAMNNYFRIKSAVFLLAHYYICRARVFLRQLPLGVCTWEMFASDYGITYLSWWLVIFSAAPFRAENGWFFAGYLVRMHENMFIYPSNFPSMRVFTCEWLIFQYISGVCHVRCCVFVGVQLWLREIEQFFRPNCWYNRLKGFIVRRWMVSKTVSAQMLAAAREIQQRIHGERRSCENLQTIEYIGSVFC